MRCFKNIMLKVNGDTDSGDEFALLLSWKIYY